MLRRGEVSAAIDLAEVDEVAIGVAGSGFRRAIALARKTVMVTGSEISSAAPRHERDPPCRGTTSTERPVASLRPGGRRHRVVLERGDEDQISDQRRAIRLFRGLLMHRCPYSARAATMF